MAASATFSMHNIIPENETWSGYFQYNQQEKRTRDSHSVKGEKKVYGKT